MFGTTCDEHQQYRDLLRMAREHELWLKQNGFTDNCDQDDEHDLAWLLIIEEDDDALMSE